MTYTDIITRLLPPLDIPLSWISILFVLFVIGCALLCLTILLSLRKTEHRWLQRAAIIMCLLTIYPSIAGTMLIAMANAHGMYQTGLTVKEVQESIRKSPVEDILTSDDNLFIYYKFGCSDCEAIYDELLPYTDTYNIPFVSTRSTQGELLRTTIPVQEVPSGVYRKKNGQAVVLTLYENGHLNQKNMDTLLQMKEQDL